MRKIIAAGAAALTAAALMAAPAQARWHGGGWHGGWHHGGRAGAGIAGFAAGALIGGALASRPYYGYGYDPYYSGDYVYDTAPYGAYGGPVYGAAPGGDVAYCQQRFKSYDPASGTYLGYDGVRHPCP